METDGEESDRMHRSLSDVLVLLVCVHLLTRRDRQERRQTKRGKVAITPWPPDSLGLR